MSRCFIQLGLVFIAVLSFHIVPSQSYAATALTVSATPSEIYPGQAVLIRVTADQPVESISGHVGDQQIMFFREGDQNVWSGLLGLDLNMPPGKHHLAYRLGFQDKTEAEGTYPLLVQTKKFPEERITVARKYVDLSKQDLARVREEKRRLRSIYALQSEQRSWQSGFSIPVNAERGSPFGLRRFFNGEPRSPHSGADLRAGSGTPVAAPNDGRVVFADELFFSGNAVVLDHGGGLYTIYAHLSDFTVAEGDMVEKEQLIGHVGATGRVTGPHLHWAAKLNGARIDPFSLIALPMPLQPESEASATILPEDPRDKGTVLPSMENPGASQGDGSR
jgi:murein DD-endopeptidase MepM/ murein hydrolase activator NlpD